MSRWSWLPADLAIGALSLGATVRTTSPAATKQLRTDESPTVAGMRHAATKPLTDS